MGRFVFVFLFILSPAILWTQKDVINETYQIRNNPHTLDDLLREILEISNINFSYSPSLAKSIDLPEEYIKQGTVEEIVNSCLKFYDYNLVSIKDKYVLQIVKPRAKILYGKVLDSLTSEPIVNAFISLTNSADYDFTNNDGVYNIRMYSDQSIYLIRALGYKTIRLSGIEIERNKGQIKLGFDNNLSPILISDKSNENFIIDKNAYDIRLDRLASHTSILGEKDPVNVLKTLSGVVSGAEGQAGFQVRGSSADKNLILLDGIPLYETSHVVGLSSIFMDESIRNVQFSKSGFAAQYAGRLSSVLDIQLKDGNKDHSETNLSMGIPGLSLNMEGPIGNDGVSYNFSLRKSWVDYAVDKVFEAADSPNSVDINYYDIVGKLAWNLSPTSKLSMSLYSGSDVLDIFKFDENVGENGVSTFNGLKWGTKLIGLNFSQILGKRTHCNISTGILNYNAQTSSNFESDTTLYTETFSKTNILDKTVKVQFQSHLNDNLKLKYGLSSIFHTFTPSIFQEIEKGNPERESDTEINSIEYGIYLESLIKVNRNIAFNLGFHLSSYQVDDISYNNFQPRVSFNYLPKENHLISFAFTRMNQHVHLLVNPGLGLPSDLWIPSTGDIAPQQAEQWSFLYHYTNKSGWNFNVEGYWKTISNIPELSVDTDFFTNIINGEAILPTYTTDESWKNEIFIGSGENYGIEFMINKDKGRLKSFLSMSYSKATRLFDDLNEGERFPYKYDRPIDINFGANYELSKSFTLGLQWIYSSGSTFSLPGDEFDSALGTILLNPGSKNNYRLPSFHQLTLNGTKHTNILGNDAKLNFGIYNIYNRLNAYYIYFYLDPDRGNIPIGKKVSLFPIIPFVDLKINID